MELYSNFTIVKPPSVYIKNSHKNIVNQKLKTEIFDCIKVSLDSFIEHCN